MLDWLNFRLGKIIGLIHALEKRYYQNKTQLCYNFGSVYNISSFYIRNFNTLASFSCLASRFESQLVGNPDDSFLVSRLRFELRSLFFVAIVA